MAIHGSKMRAFQPATAGMPFGAVLTWAMIDLHLAFGIRLTQLALETPQAWCNVSTRRRVRESEDSNANN